jgi:hypothetical protein
MWRDLLGRVKAIYQRGSGWIDLVYSKVLLTMIFLKEFQDFFTGYNLSLYLVVPVVVVGVVVLCFIIGFVDLKWGIWKHENNCGWYYVPMNMELMGKVDRILENQEKIVKR